MGMLLPVVLLCFLFCDKTLTKGNLEGGVYLAYMLLAILGGTGGGAGGTLNRNSRLEPGGRNCSKYHRGGLLSGSLWLMFSYLSYTTQAQTPRGGATRSGLGPLTSISIQKMPHRHAHRPTDGCNFSVGVPSSDEQAWLNLRLENHIIVKIN